MEGSFNLEWKKLKHSRSFSGKGSVSALSADSWHASREMAELEESPSGESIARKSEELSLDRKLLCKSPAHSKHLQPYCQWGRGSGTSRAGQPDSLPKLVSSSFSERPYTSKTKVESDWGGCLKLTSALHKQAHTPRHTYAHTKTYILSHTHKHKRERGERY